MQDGEPLPAGRHKPPRENTRLGGAARQTRRGRLGAHLAETFGPPVATPHRRQLEALIDLLRVSLELEARCDFGDGPRATGPGRSVFVAHFDGWRDALQDWEGRVRRARAAPAALWSLLDAAARGIGVPEPPLAVGPLVDRLATLTLQRSREGRLGTPHALFLQSLRSGYGESARVMVYVEGQCVARLPGKNKQPAVELERRVQRLFDSAQRSDAALDVGRATDAVLEAKGLLLARLNALAASDSIAFAPACPVCRARTAGAGQILRSPA